MRDQREEWTLDVAQITSRVRRRWRIVAAAALLGAGLGAVTGVLTPPSYTATASVAVSPIRMPGSTNVQAVNVDTERAVMRSREVAALAAGRVRDGIGTDALVDASTVAAPEGSEVLQVSVTAQSPRLAAERADAMAQAYLVFRAQTALQAAQPAIDALDARIAVVPPSATGKLADLRSQKVALQHVGDAIGRVIGRAVVPAVPSSLPLVAYVVGGGGAGLLAGFVLALLRDRGDPLVRDAARFSELVGHAGIVVPERDEHEALRWVMRALRSAPERRQHDLVVAAVLGEQPRLTGRLLGLLPPFAALTARRRVRIVSAEELAPERFEREYRFTAEEGDEIVLLDARRITSPAQRAVLLEAVDAVVLVGGRHTRMRSIAALLAPLAGVARGSVIPVFVDGKGARDHRVAPRPVTVPRPVAAR